MGRKGFTLVEIILSLTIFAILSAGIVYAFGSELRSWQRIAAACEKQQVEHFVLARMTKDIRSASEILPDSTATLLSLKIGPEVIEYTLANQKIKRKKNGYSSYLTVEGEIKEMLFSCPNPKQVTVALDEITATLSLRN